MIRVVVDPGVFVSALISPADSPPAQLLDAWVDDELEVVVSEGLLAELRRVVLRPKFRRWFSEREAGELLGRLERHATNAGDPPPLPGATRDPDDDYLVALAGATRVEAIVSGDRDLSSRPVSTSHWSGLRPACVRQLRETRR